MADEPRKPSITDGIRTGIGILNAFREAVEETFKEAVDRGDMSPEGAKSAMRDVAQRLQATLDDARERFDFAARKEFEELRAEIQRLRERVDRLESERGPGSPDPAIVITD